MGYIKLHKCIRHNWLWTDEEPFDKRSAWIDLLLLASWKDEKRLYGGKLIEFKRGNVHVSLTELASRWKWHRTTVSRFLRLLESDGMVKVNATTHGTTITIVNWDLYQSEEYTNATTDAQQTHDQRTTDARPMHTIEEYKEIKEVKEVYNNPPLPPLNPPKGKRTTKQAKVDHNVNLLDELVKPYGFSEGLTDLLRDWMRYKGSEKGFMYQETGMKALLSQTAKHLAEYGESAVTDCINLSMSNGYQGIVWDRLKDGKSTTTRNNGYTFMDMWKEEYG